MNERQRQDYLEAMGIQTWFPRFVLPAAKPSHTCDWDYDDYPVEAFPEPAPSMSAPEQPLSVPPQNMGYQQPAYIPQQAPQPSPVPAAGVLKESSDILGELGFTTPQSTPDTKGDEPCAAQTTDAEVIPAEPFRLAVVDVSETCLAIVDLPWSGLNQFTGYHERLLRNILKAVNQPCDQTFEASVFAWPIIQEPIPVDRKYAREAVQCFLANQFGWQRRKTVLLFGHNSGTYLWGSQESWDKPFDSFRGIQEKDGVTYAITCSLGEMMGIPELKADAWADLKGLCKPS
ncbi:hypothetical protein [Sansalvadorimonas verongulae]|uniref:hypothetical protein n=1 Tax=Sansalvadorimonas verongulae TaxID=2172824 RepID=UPI0012BBEBE6|nr:hypothetical protein [Sansalvadorimonas verongulae]MTI15542.1 hypothetical protein [Sansalvadorimonas verongulae]